VRRTRTFLMYWKSKLTRAAGDLFITKIKARDMSVLCRQFAAMSEAGIPVLKCLDVLARQSEGGRLRAVLHDVSVGIEYGQSLSESFNKHNSLLPEIFVNLLAAGEASGTLAQALERLAVHFEKERVLREKIKSAMAYPLLVAGMSMLALIAMIVLVVPVFADIYESVGAELPLPTRVVIFTSAAISKYWYVFLATGAAAFFLLRKLALKERKYFDLLLLRLPLFGRLTHRAVVARFARTLATLLNSGIPLMQSLKITRNASGNALVAEEIDMIRTGVASGGGMAPFLEKSALFPPMAASMVAVGEESGSLDSLLERLAEFYESEAEAMAERMSGLVEPLLIAGVGVLVALIALSVYLPLFGLAGAVQSSGGLP